MSRRFSRIRQAPRLETAYTAYKAWQDRVDPYTPRAAGSRPGGFISLAVTPFGLPATDKIKVKASRRAHTQMSGTIGSRADTVLTNAINDAGFEPAKIVLFVGTGSSTTATSNITNLQYQKRSGASYIHPFGASTATEREYEAFEVLAGAFLGAGVNNRVSYQPERVYAV